MTGSGKLNFENSIENNVPRLNMFLTGYLDKETERAYEEFAFKYDKQAFRILTIAAIIIGLLVILPDYYRTGELLGSVMVRLIPAVVLSAGLIATFLISEKKPRLLQLVIFTVVMINNFSYLIGMSMLPYPDYILPNTIITCIFFSFTVSGLRFRYALIFLILIYTSYLILCNFIIQNPFWVSQIVSLSVNSLIGVTAGFIIEGSRRKNFINNRQLKFQKEKLESVDAIKNKLFSILSHDLRSPMKKLIAMVDMLNKQQITKEEFDKYTGKISNDLKNTTSFMENLLYWSKSLISGYESVKKKIDLKEIVNQNFEVFKEEVLTKKLILNNNIANAEFVLADEDTLNISLRNLISNAIKFTPESGTIDVGLYYPTGYFELYISDSGIGIETEKINELFSLNIKSTQGTHGEHGTGLGLYLLNEFLDKSGGKISCESKIGKGSTFRIRLPV